MFTPIKSKNQKGFTLIELLIVIGIMAVLLSVAALSLTGVIGSGAAESKSSELNAVQTAVDAHMAKNNLSTITARATAAVIASADTDAPFKSFLRRLPTKHTYSWDAAGTVTQP